MRIALGLAAGSLAAFTAFAGAALAGYTERPVTFIVPWPPGDLEDQLTRVIADQFTQM